MDAFENSIIRGIHISRYIASWINVRVPIERAYRGLNRTGLFIDWLRSLVINGEHLTEDEVWRIYNFASNGKLELESSAKQFIKRKGL